MWFGVCVIVPIPSHMGRDWKVAERYDDILNQVVQEHEHSYGPQPRMTEPEQKVKILVDMRRRRLESGG